MVEHKEEKDDEDDGKDEVSDNEMCVVQSLPKVFLFLFLVVYANIKFLLISSVLNQCAP